MWKAKSSGGKDSEKLVSKKKNSEKLWTFPTKEKLTR